MGFENGGEIAGIRRIGALEQKDELQAWEMVILGQKVLRKSDFGKQKLWG